MANKVRKEATKRQTERFIVRELKRSRGSSWEVFGYKLNGDRIRSRFKTEREAIAEAHALSLQTADGDLRTVATKLTEEQLADAQAALHILGDTGTLLAAASFYKDNYRHTSGLPIQDAIIQYAGYKEKRKRSERTIYEIKNRCGTFATFVENKPVDEVLQQDVELFLKQYGGQSYNNYRSKLFSFFKWADAESLCSGNPVAPRQSKNSSERHATPKKATTWHMSRSHSSPAYALIRN